MQGSITFGKELLTDDPLLLLNLLPWKLTTLEPLEATYAVIYLICPGQQRQGVPQSRWRKTMLQYWG